MWPLKGSSSSKENEGDRKSIARAQWPSSTPMQNVYRTPAQERGTKSRLQHSEPIQDTAENPFLATSLWRNSGSGSFPTPASSIGDSSSPLAPRGSELKRFKSLFGHEGGRSVSQDFDSYGKPRGGLGDGIALDPTGGLQGGPGQSYWHGATERQNSYDRNAAYPRQGNFTGDMDLDISLDAASFMNLDQEPTMGGEMGTERLEMYDDFGTIASDFDTQHPSGLILPGKGGPATRSFNAERPNLSPTYQKGTSQHAQEQRSSLHSQYQMNFVDTPTRRNAQQLAQAGGSPSFGRSDPARTLAYNYRAAGPVASGIPLKPVADMPDKFRSLFPFPYFNAVQSHCFELAFRSDRNLVVSAPTGSGKTCIMELAILHQLSQPDGDNAKVVYMAPTKALCNERTKDWQQKFRTLGISCNELTGDTDNLRTYEIQRSNIIVTTPEKWDSMTRRWRDYKSLMGLLRLIMIDECHCLNEPGRGATLEVVVSRMKTVNLELQRDSKNRPHFASRLRLLALSATVPNIQDIAAWLKHPDHSPAEVRVFGEEFRPVQLQKEVFGYYSNNNNYFSFENSLDYKLIEVIGRYSHNKPTLVFCATRKSVINATDRLVKHCSELMHATGNYGPMHPFVKTRQISERLKEIKAKLSDKKLAELVVHGVAFHHGGLNYGDRHLIESSFLKGAISVVCATSTLAVGVNLPAHLVIIKGTKQYVGNQYTEYSELDIMQMLGRAGRPQFDDSGVAVIMTTVEDRKKYEDMVTGRQIIESSLHENLIEHLNSEVVLGAIKSVDLAIEWLQSSFLYVRMRNNPAHYKLKNCSAVEGKLSAERRLESICVRDLQLLNSHELVVMAEDQKRLDSTDYGRAMAKFYIKYQTAVTALQMKPKATLRNVLETLCKAEEFSNLRFHSDKGHLNALNKNPSMRFPIKGKVVNVEHKVNILIQCALGSIPFTEQKTAQSLTLETSGIMQTACRIARCKKICQVKRDLVSLRNAIDLTRCLAAKTWENSPLMLKQIENIGPSLARMLANAGISTFEKLEKTDPRHLEFTVNRNPPFGNKVLESAATFPRFKLEISQFKDLSRPTEVELYVNAGLTNGANVRTYGKRGQSSATFIAGTSDDMFIDYRRFTIKKLQEGQSFRVKVQLTSPNQRIICSLLSEDIVGLDLNEEITPDVKPIHFRNLRQSQAGVDRLKQQNSAYPQTRPLSRPIGSDDNNSRLSRDGSEAVALTESTNIAAAAAASGPSSKSTGFRTQESLYDHILDDDDFDFDESNIPPLPSPLRQETSSGANTAGDAARKHTTNYDSGVVRRRDGSLVFEPDSPSPSRKSPNTQYRQKTQDSNLPLGNVPCAHKCKNKQSCTHKCCKIGVPAKTAKKRKMQSAEGPNHKSPRSPQEIQIDIDTNKDYGHQLRRHRPIVGLPSQKNYDSLNESDEDVPLPRSKDVFKSQAPQTSKPWHNKEQKAVSASVINQDVMKPKLPRGSTTTGMMFLDIEADDDETSVSQSNESEIEGEFDGWLVADDELEEDYYVDGSPVENAMRSGATSGKGTALFREEDDHDLDNISQTPSKRRKLVKRSNVVDSSEDEGFVVSQSGKASKAMVPASGQVSCKSDSLQSSQVDSKSRRLLAEYSFKPALPRSGDMRTQLGPLNKQHSRITQSSTIPARLSKSVGEGPLSASPDLGFGDEDVSSSPSAGQRGFDSDLMGDDLRESHKQDQFVAHHSLSKALEDGQSSSSAAKVFGNSIFDVTRHDLEQLDNANSRTVLGRPASTNRSTEHQKNRNHAKVFSEARESLSSWITSLRVEDFAEPLPKTQQSGQVEQQVESGSVSQSVAPSLGVAAVSMSQLPR
ncbi:uncharacterized protein SPPG_09286 [Spizellomyces punctatus DAOM BR117]|uniref:DNA 3'-5' helicase n=1 Tax=Spizellomyces punctatus (strain DAOM BR117) TaxID=645134 RepID=A0A0L0HCP5_SPIPD|nr:uncharacterized protein SPPG_09286 [Spizellomyces punctatus DAOM BR117]KNC99300.1 hypothetical protein SPPG_09286 [Spizellomyces punctatus DAOM BR117]|eukprot:XP_016607340.1 hypothetical protein SPPG_09286 [Spizellomyces punctatus DAOM BR117]